MYFCIKTNTLVEHLIKISIDRSVRKTKTKYSLILGLVPCIVFEGEDGVIPEKIQLVAEKTKNEISLKSFPVVGGG